VHGQIQNYNPAARYILQGVSPDGNAASFSVSPNADGVFDLRLAAIYLGWKFENFACNAASQNNGGGSPGDPPIEATPGVGDGGGPPPPPPPTDDPD
jgi:hypothetical protein